MNKMRVINRQTGDIFMNCIYNRLLLNNLKVISQKYGHNI